MDTLEKIIPDSVCKRYVARLSNSIAQTLAGQPFWWVGVENADKPAMIYESATGLLWDAAPDLETKHSVADGETRAAASSTGALSGWRVPDRDELKAFASDGKNPLRKGSHHRLLEQYNWLSTAGGIDVDDFRLAYNSGLLLACNEFLLGKSVLEFAREAILRNWQVSDCTPQKSPLSFDLLKGAPDLQMAYRDIDEFSVRLPELESTQFTDPSKGLWELWGMDEATLTRQGVRSRNPALDVRDCNVAIDFGTSSTVVAYDDNDQHKLLRVGMGNYWEQERPEHYENPTLLEFLDFPGLLDAWQSETFRPGVAWDHVRCSHAALQAVRDNTGDPRVVASTLGKIKHWALREQTMPRLRLADRLMPDATEHELAALTLRNPVRGQPMSVSPQDPFDPIELYAWFLGLNINWRGRGLFLRYYMSFPVGYPREVKDKILASFRRGLLRSLPATLVGEPVFARFSVEERASEPAAYAAAVMPYLGIKPTREGVAYAVFDFGGGTTDFDFGYYRLPTPEEEDEGKEEVFEHFGAAGDKFLGGENLLEHLAYRVLRHNLDICRRHRIAFTRPLDADDFAGSEMFLEHTQAASTNTAMLMARLRPLWESGALDNGSGIETINLLDRDGSKVECQLVIPLDELNAWLQQRVDQGVCNFLAALKKAFDGHSPEHVQVLLAGNSSRSFRVLATFKALQASRQAETPDRETQSPACRYAARLFRDQSLSLTIHEPLPSHEQAPFTPTAKTGVALGLLRLCPGSVVKVVNRASERTGGEAPFAHYVGRVRQGHFQALLLQGGDYDQWHEIGVPSEGVFNLYHSQSPQAHTGLLAQGDPALFKKRLDLLAARQGHRVFARIVGPSLIELCTAASLPASAGNELENTSFLELDT